MGKIYLACFNEGIRSSDVVGYALAEDGTVLASHLSSSISFSKHDMGLTSDWKHDTYSKHYPDGFELIWIDDPKNDPQWQEVLRLNKIKYKEKKEQNESSRSTQQS